MNRDRARGSELLALSADMPDEIALHLEVAQLFAEAGDDAHALEQFQRALRLDPGNRAAIARRRTGGVQARRLLRARVRTCGGCRRTRRGARHPRLSTSCSPKIRWRPASGRPSGGTDWSTMSATSASASRPASSSGEPQR